MHASIFTKTALNMSFFLILHPVYEVSKLIVPSFAVLGTQLNVKIRFLIPPHFVLLERIHQIYFHRAKILAAGYYAAGEDRSVFDKMLALYVKVWNTTETMPTDYWHLFQSAIDSMEMQYCHGKTLEMIKQEAAANAPATSAAMVVHFQILQYIPVL